MLGFVFSQRFWPGVGDIDDCWCLADMQAIDAVAPWLRKIGVPAYREAAGNPDQPGITGGTITQSARAIRTLYPTLGPLIRAISADDHLGWDTFLSIVKPARLAVSLSVMNGALPLSLRYSTFTGGHRIAVQYSGTGVTWLLCNPLAQPHSKPDSIDQSQLRAAVTAYGAGVRAIIMPGSELAFATHPFYNNTFNGGVNAAIAAASTARK